MRHFKRKLKAPTGSLDTTRLWKRFIEKELETNNLLYLLHLSKDIRNTLLNLKVEHAHFFAGEDNNCSIAFRDLSTDEIFDMSLYFKDNSLNFFQDFPGYEDIDDVDWSVVFDIFKKAPLAMFCYHEYLYFKMKKKTYVQFID